MNLRKLSLVLLVLVPVIGLARPLDGDRAPDFSLPDTLGNYHALSDYRGKVVQLFFFLST